MPRTGELPQAANPPHRQRDSGQAYGAMVVLPFYKAPRVPFSPLSVPQQQRGGAYRPILFYGIRRAPIGKSVAYSVPTQILIPAR
jgi:hypothetical protein